MAEEINKKKQQSQKTSSSNIFIILGVFIIGILIGGTSLFLQDSNNSSSNNENTLELQEGLIASLITATEIEPNNTLLFVQLGNAYYDTAQVKPAIEAYSKALALDSNLPHVLIDYATMLRADSKLEESLEAYDKALLLSKNNPLALYNKGLLFYYDMKNKDKAIETWNILLTQNPQARTPDGRLVRALLAEMQK